MITTAAAKPHSFSVIRKCVLLTITVAILALTPVCRLRLGKVARELFDVRFSS